MERLTKVCTSCALEKSIDWFKKRKAKKKNGEFRYYTDSFCRTCRNKANYDRVIRGVKKAGLPHRTREQILIGKRKRLERLRKQKEKNRKEWEEIHELERRIRAKTGGDLKFWETPSQFRGGKGYE